MTVQNNYRNTKKKVKYFVAMQKIMVLSISVLPLLFFSTLLLAEHQLDPVTLQLKWKPSFQFAGYYAALEQGFYEQEGLDVTIHSLSSNIDVLSGIVEGEIDYAVGDTGIIAHYANGAPIKALAAIFQHNALVFIAKQSSGIISPYEMSGKRIMFDSVTGDDAPLVAMLAESWIEPTSYTQVPRTFSSQALIDGQVDVMSAYITAQPFILKQRGIKLNIINPQNYGVDFYGDILYTSQEEIENNPGRAERFRRASLKGWHYALENTDDLIQLLKNKYGSTLSLEALRYEAQETRKLILPDTIPLGTIEAKRLRRAADIYARLEIAKRIDEQKLKNFIVNMSAPLQLSPKEKAWLKMHPIIRVGIDRDYAPYEWVNEKGHYVGIAADYMYLLEEKLGVRFEIIKDKPWHEVLAMAKRDEIDMFSSLNVTLDREKYLSFSDPYVTNPIVIVNATGNGYVGTLKNLAGKTVAVERDYFTHENLARHYPKINLLVLESTEEALIKVSIGDADAFVGDAAYTNHAIKEANLFNLQFAGETSRSSSNSVGVMKSHPELLSIINKALDSIEYQEAAEIKERWMGLKIKTGIQTDLIVKISLLVLAFLTLLLFRNYRLKQSGKILQEMKDSLQLYSRVYEEAHEGITITDANKNIIDVNPAFCEITGYCQDDVIGKNFSMFNSGKQSPDYYADIWHGIKNDGHWQGEVWSRKKDGELFAELLTISELKDEGGEVVNYVGISTDITQRKYMEDDIHSSLQHLKLYREQAPLAAIEWNTDFQVINWNNEAQKMFGYQLDEVKGHDFVDIMLPDSAVVDVEQVWQDLMAQTGGTVSINEIITKDGRTLICELHNTALVDDSGKVIGAASLVLDITQLKSQQAQLQRVQKMDALGKIVGGIAHDYNNMLGVILGYTELMNIKYGNVDGLQKYIDIITQAGRRGQSLTKRMLDFSKQKSTQGHVIDLHSVLGVQKELLEKAVTARIQLHYQLCESPWLIWVDPNELEDALLNMTINAQHAMPEGGTLSFSTEKVHLPHTEAALLGLPENDYLLLSIADTGIGMDEETITKIFDPFFSTKGSGGTGLGLSQVYGSMERAGGTVRVSSQIDEGSEFRLYFPRYRGEETTSTENKQRTTHYQGNGETILVVDDEPALCELVQEILTMAGYRVLMADDGASALEVLDENRVDLVLSDVIMPKMNGYQLASHIQEKYPDIKIQLVSGYGDSQRNVSSDESLHRAMLYKPYSSTELLSRITALLEEAL